MQPRSEDTDQQAGLTPGAWGAAFKLQAARSFCLLALGVCKGRSPFSEDFTASSTSNRDKAPEHLVLRSFQPKWAGVLMTHDGVHSSKVSIVTVQVQNLYRTWAEKSLITRSEGSSKGQGLPKKFHACLRRRLWVLTSGQPIGCKTSRCCRCTFGAPCKAAPE